MQYPVRLSLIDKARIAYARVDAAGFIGILTPYLRDKVEPNNYFYICGIDNFSFDYYGKTEDGDEYISDGIKKIPLARGRSFIGGILNKLSTNHFVQEYHELKDQVEHPFD